MKKAFDGSVNYYQVMDELGNIDQSLFPRDLDDNKILEMYRYMSLARALDAKALSLQRQGRAVTYAPLVGEEATQIGSAMALGKDDYFVPNFRQQGVFLARGFGMDGLFLYFRGYEEGNMIPRNMHALPGAVPVSTQMQHAAGLAFAQKYLKTGASVIGFVGDGGTSEGDFYEALNFAGVTKSPLVAIIENNQWAISMPRSRQTAAQTLAQKAIAAGIPGVQVDGNDVIGVYKVIKDALANAKNGPTLVECITYRMSMHTTADDPTKYRPQEDVDVWKKRDPIARVRAYLAKKNLWNDQKEQALTDQNLRSIDEAVEKAESFKGDPASIFEHVYSYMPDILQEELDAAAASNFWQQQQTQQENGE
ncbi:MAG: pyruvate dehydrogenase (acetyl-transferring) E1 component subunit alpha [Candidatus Micrarchaeales archaeon]|nr:pyruvate dehydrogenase (acetyl-transferring) E1 component subunit alpha [Candidatus Micrarchaeales archaeon]